MSKYPFFQVNLVESAGSLTPEELGQMQAMSVVLARFALLLPCNKNISTIVN